VVRTPRLPHSFVSCLSHSVIHSARDRAIPRATASSRKTVGCFYCDLKNHAFHLPPLKSPISNINLGVYRCNQTVFGRDSKCSQQDLSVNPSPTAKTRDTGCRRRSVDMWNTY